MKEKMQNNLLLKVISVLFAILLWLFVINTGDPVATKTFSNIPVDMLNEQVLDELNQTYKIKSGSMVSFTVKGKKTVLDKLKNSDFRATADVSSMSKVNSIPIRIVPLRYKDQLEISSGSNQTVKVVLEDLKQSQIPVEIVVRGKPAEGYTVSTKTATPNLISVSGPKSVVRQVDSVQVSVNVTGLKDTVSVTKAVRCLDSDGDEISQNRLTLDATKVKVKIRFSHTKKIPLVVNTKGTPSSGYVLGSITYSPKTVLVTGNEESLNQIKEINLATLDISNTTKDVEKTIKAKDIKLPDGVSFVEDTSKMGNFVVKARIAKQKTRTLSLDTSQIKIKNNTNNYKVTFDVSTVDIKVKGLKSVIEALTTRDLNPTIDLQGLEEGTHSLQVKLKEVADMDVTNTPNVKITVSES